MNKSNIQNKKTKQTKNVSIYATISVMVAFIFFGNILQGFEQMFANAIEEQKAYDKHLKTENGDDAINTFNGPLDGKEKQESKFTTSSNGSEEFECENGHCTCNSFMDCQEMHRVVKCKPWPLYLDGCDY